jgi:hypothetical protein
MVDVDKSNWSPHIMLLLLVTASTLSIAKIGLYSTRIWRRENQIVSIKEANRINKEQNMTQETAVLNINNQLKSSTENEKTEERKRKPTHGQFYRDLERPSVDKEISLVLLCRSEIR